MKHVKRCPHCPRIFTAEGKFEQIKGRLNANLTNHIKGAHPEHYSPSKAAVARNSVRHQILISGPKVVAEPVPPITDVNQIGKRPYTRKPQPPSSVCFCPKCGCNIRAVQVAMGL